MAFPLIPLALMSGLSIAGLQAYGKRSKGNNTAVAPPIQPADGQPPPVSLRQEAVGILNDLHSESQDVLRDWRRGRSRPLVDELSALGKTTVETTAASSERVWANLQAHLPAALRSDTGRDQQRAEMGVAAPSSTEQERAIDRKLTLAGAATALTVGGALGYPLLSLLSAPILLYLGYGMIVGGVRQLRDERRIGAAVLDAVICISVLVMHFFFAGAIFFFLYHLSEKLLTKTQDQSRKSLTNVFGDQPRFAWIEQAGVEVQVTVATLQVGDIISVHAGEVIPIDGTVVGGAASVDQHMLTGEAQPVEKSAGTPVFAATIVRSGKLNVRVDQTGATTVAAQIGQMLNQTLDYKSTVESRGQQIADRSALPSLVLGALTWPLLGPYRALAVLLAAFGYNMRIVAPISVLNFLRLASAQGILIKDGRGLELLGKIDTVVFDKTGTLTQEEPTVAAIHPCPGWTAQDVLMYAAAAETRQTHPVARAILHAAQAQALPVLVIDEAAYEIGFGIKVTVGDKIVRVGSERFMTMENIAVPPDLSAQAATAQTPGHSLIYVAVGDALAGVLELQATIRPEAQAIIADLHRRGLITAIISGDHEGPTRQLAETLGIDRYYAQTLPERKADLVKQLQAEGRTVCFVGDGINDAIALKQANVSISLRGASTSATDTAQIIMMNGNLTQLPRLFDLAQQLADNLQVGLVSTVLPGVICVSGVYLLHFGVLAATLLYNVGLGVSVTNAMSPMWQQSDPVPDAVPDAVIEGQDDTK